MLVLTFGTLCILNYLRWIYYFQGYPQSADISQRSIVVGMFERCHVDNYVDPSGARHGYSGGFPFRDFYLRVFLTQRTRRTRHTIPSSSGVVWSPIINGCGSICGMLLGPAYGLTVQHTIQQAIESLDGQKNIKILLFQVIAAACSSGLLFKTTLPTEVHFTSGSTGILLWFVNLL